MPVLLKTQRDKYEKELRARFETLICGLLGRDLTSATEGAGKGHWRFPEAMCATQGSKLDISMAVADFRTILMEVNKIR